MPCSCRTMSSILLQVRHFFIAIYLLSSGMGRCALTRSLYLVHSKSPTCTCQGPVLQLGLGTSTHLYRGDQGGRQCPWSLSYRWIQIKHWQICRKTFTCTRIKPPVQTHQIWGCPDQRLVESRMSWSSSPPHWEQSPRLRCRPASPPGGCCQSSTW